MTPFRLLLLGCLLHAAGGAAAPAPARAPLKPARDATVEPLLFKLALLMPAGRAQIREQLDRIADRERVAAGLAHALGKQTYYCQGAIRYIAAGFRDRRLAPYLAQTIRTCRGHLQLEAIKAARHIPDPCLVSVLLKEGLDSRGFRELPAAHRGRVELMYELTSGAAAAALHALTDGKIGSLDLRIVRRPELSEKQQKQRAQLTAQWRAWWDANKPRDPEKREAIVEVPEVIRKDLSAKAVAFLQKVYPDLSDEWLQKNCTQYFSQPRYVVRELNSIDGPRVGFAGRPGVSLSFPRGDRVSLWTEGVPDGVTIQEREKPLGRDEALEAARAVLQRLLGRPADAARMTLTKSGESRLDKAYYFEWREQRPAPLRHAGKLLRVEIRTTDGLMQYVRLREALRAPKVPVEAIARRARAAIKGFHEERLKLVRHYYACVETLVWLYEVPPPPMGAPEDRTLWDATTGQLLYSEVLNGGTPGKPYRSQAFLTASDPQQAERHLAKSVELQTARLLNDARE